jgi:hypothetical protein
MIKIELDDSQAWFLSIILERALANYDLFTTVDENDDETFDEDFHEEILTIVDKLDALRLK